MARHASPTSASVGVTAVLDLPEVGRNLVDHILMGVAYAASEVADMCGHLNGTEITREIWRARGFAPWTSGEAVPGATVTDETDLRRYVRSVPGTWFHPAGSCRMGIDARAVVDPTLGVHGVANLRVADASVMPRIVSSNTNAASMMIGWRAAELVAAGRQ